MSCCKKNKQTELNYSALTTSCIFKVKFLTNIVLLCSMRSNYTVNIPSGDCCGKAHRREIKKEEYNITKRPNKETESNPAQ